MVSVVGEWFEGNMSGLGGIRVVWVVYEWLGGMSGFCGGRVVLVVYEWFGWYMSGLGGI